MTAAFPEVRRYAEPPVCKKEILHYMGCRKATEDVLAMVDRAVAECEGKLTYSVCFRKFPVRRDGGTVDLSFARAESKALAKNLDGCSHAIVFAATVGIALDRLILRYSRLSPSFAICLQAYGAERIEALCDAFCRELAEEYGDARPRFSPGYGDLPLNLQTDIFRILDCSRRIGLTLTESLLMSPTKSVTAIVGIRERQPKL